MKIRIIISIVFIFLLPSLVFTQDYRSLSTNFSCGISTGYDVGLPVQAHITIKDLAEGLPLSFRFTMGYSFLLDAGIPEQARHVFINENNNGVPDKSASRWSFGLDFLHAISIASLNNSCFYVGVRRSLFTGTFEFIGGDEIFDVHANQWGLATGVETYFRMSTHTDLFFSVGGEYYFPSILEGHDASYSPDGQYVNQREHYTYNDADHAINQPKVLPKIMVGINYRF